MQIKVAEGKNRLKCGFKYWQFQLVVVGAVKTSLLYQTIQILILIGLYYNYIVYVFGLYQSFILYLGCETDL